MLSDPRMNCRHLLIDLLHRPIIQGVGLEVEKLPAPALPALSMAFSLSSAVTRTLLRSLGGHRGLDPFIRGQDSGTFLKERKKNSRTLPEMGAESLTTSLLPLLFDYITWCSLPPCGEHFLGREPKPLA
ncbi:hypothetical protein HAX54_016967 [Datura stramonium]|uniref:Uncharacterized protein n=1 Tax=Datura stramonium TaxID=4076 RepID=A0ABS8ULA8_DATST|nr:hypothetical protein [Datura stramonium]